MAAWGVSISLFQCLYDTCELMWSRRFCEGVYKCVCVFVRVMSLTTAMIQIGSSHTVCLTYHMSFNGARAMCGLFTYRKQKKSQTTYQEFRIICYSLCFTYRSNLSSLNITYKTVMIHFVIVLIRSSGLNNNNESTHDGLSAENNYLHLWPCITCCLPSTDGVIESDLSICDFTVEGVLISPLHVQCLWTLRFRKEIGNWINLNFR